jgi:hypothetical protein
MPLSHGKSKKTFSKNVETEMNSGKPQDQALAIAYSVKRKAANKRKKMAEGGMAYRNDSAKTESRPMPSEVDADHEMVRKNSGNKAPGQDSWTDRPTMKQVSKGPRTTPIKHPSMVPTDAFSVRMRDEEDDLQSSAGTNNGPQRQPPEHDNEEGPDRQGPSTPSLKMKRMAKGGMINDFESMDDAENDNVVHPEGLESDNDQMGPDEDEYMADHFAKGGEVDRSNEANFTRAQRNQRGRVNDSTGPATKGVNMPAGKNLAGEAGSEGTSQAGANLRAGLKIAAKYLHKRTSEQASKIHPKLKGMASGGTVISGSRDMDYAEGGMADGELEEEHDASLSAAIMARRDRLHAEIDSGAHDEDMAVRMALGGEINEDGDDIHSAGSMDTHEDADQVDLSRNADEDANEEDQSSFNALRKENYSESAGLDKLDQPEDSNETGDSREKDSENENDMVNSIMKKRRFNKA